MLLISKLIKWLAYGYFALVIGIFLTNISAYVLSAPSIPEALWRVLQVLFEQATPDFSRWVGWLLIALPGVLLLTLAGHLEDKAIARFQQIK